MSSGLRSRNRKLRVVTVALLAAHLLGLPDLRADVPWRIALEDATHPDLPIPTPSETPIEMIISGRTSTLKSIRIVKTGQKIPKTYAGQKINNTPGFTWYVTRHYAMKAQVCKQVSESAVIDFLTVSELAYPHQVRVVGREPAEIDARRMAIVYAKSLDELRRAVASDLGAPYRGGGGGVAIYGNITAYNYPSGGLMYHKRDLVMHENMHMLEMCAVGKDFTPVRHREGITHAIAQHVYDEEKKQLTVAVLDRAPANDFYDRGLRDLEKEFVSGLDFYEGRAAKPYRPGVYTLLTQFCWCDPGRLMKWRLWRDEMYRLKGVDKRENDRRLMAEVFGPPEEFDKAWRAWIAERRNTFHFACWGWEQIGNTVRAWGWPPKGFRWSQLDVNYSPYERVEYDPLRMDYPAIPAPPIVGEVKRGADEPSMGCVVDFGDEPDKGLAGLALGRLKQTPSTVVVNKTGKLVIDRTSTTGDKEALDLPKELKDALKDGKDKVGLTVRMGGGKSTFVVILVHKSRELLVDGGDLGLPKKTFALSNELKDAMKKSGNTVGMNVKVAKESLDITLRAGEADAMTEMKASVPIDAKLREMLLNERMAVLAKDGRHRVTPFIGVGRRMEPDLSVPAPLGRWRFPGEDELYRLYRAAWILGREAPPSLTRLRDMMVDAFDKEPVAQGKAMATYGQTIAKVRRDLASVADEAKRGLAVAALLGVSLDLGFDVESTSEQPIAVATIRGACEGEVTGTVELKVGAAVMDGPASTVSNVRVKAGEVARAKWQPDIHESDPSSFMVMATAKLECEGTKFTLESQVIGRPSVPRWWVIGPFDNPGGGPADIAHPVEKEPIDLAKAYVGQKGKQLKWQKVERDPKSRPGAELIVNLNSLYGKPSNVAGYVLVWVEAAKERDAVLALGSEDGFVAWVNRERVHSVLEAPRTYRSRGDQMPIQLKKGMNEILIKVTLTSWGWKFGACITDTDGRPLDGIRYLLSSEPQARADAGTP